MYIYDFVIKHDPNLDTQKDLTLKYIEKLKLSYEYEKFKKAVESVKEKNKTLTNMIEGLDVFKKAYKSYVSNFNKLDDIFYGTYYAYIQGSNRDGSINENDNAVVIIKVSKGVSPSVASVEIVQAPIQRTNPRFTYSNLTSKVSKNYKFEFNFRASSTKTVYAPRDTTEHGNKLALFSGSNEFFVFENLESFILGQDEIPIIKYKRMKDSYNNRLPKEIVLKKTKEEHNLPRELSGKLFGSQGKNSIHNRLIRAEKRSDIYFLIHTLPIASSKYFFNKAPYKKNAKFMRNKKPITLNLFQTDDEVFLLDISEEGKYLVLEQVSNVKFAPSLSYNSIFVRLHKDDSKSKYNAVSCFKNRGQSCIYGNLN